MSFSTLKRLPLVLALVAAFFVAAPPTDADAQVTVKFGPRFGLPVGDYSADVEEQGYAATFFVGGDLRVSSAVLPLDVAVTGDYYLTDPVTSTGVGVGSIETSVFMLGADAIFPFGIDNQIFTPYLGVGPRLSINSVETGTGEESATNFGLGARFGAEIGFGSIRPFVEAEYSLILNGRFDSPLDRFPENGTIERTTASAFNVKAGLLFVL